MMMQRLIWKDVLTIRPLIIAGVVCVFALNLMAFLFWRMDGSVPDHLIGWSIAMWIVAPNFVAFGAPAMLVGTEEEAGTMRWLRTLPVQWQQIASSKLWVAAAATALTWLLSSLVLMMIRLRWGPTDFVEAADLLSLSGIVLLFYLSAILVLLGFVMAYAIRSPLAGLLAMVPAYAFTLIVVSNLVVFFELLRPNHELTWRVVPIGIASLAVVWALQRWLARRRLLLPERAGSDPSAASNTSVPNIRLSRPMGRPLRTRPSEVMGLLWQQVRQTAPTCIALILISTGLSFVFYASQANRDQFTMVHFVGAFSPIFVMLSASWLGTLVFHGDNVRGRRGFFADRGISPTRVWWTRMLPPAVGCLLLLVSVVVLFLPQVGQRMFTEILLQYLTMALLLFAFGQLVSQWVDRPLLAFFAAPAYACVIVGPAVGLSEYFFGTVNFGAFVLAVPVLLFATWRLTGAWLEGRDQSAYSARVVGYSAVAVLLPCVWPLTQFVLAVTIQYTQFGLIQLQTMVAELGVTP